MGLIHVVNSVSLVALDIPQLFPAIEPRTVALMFAFVTSLCEGEVRVEPHLDILLLLTGLG
jgi:hypothetical protein